MTKYALAVKEKAINLRKRGYSLDEVAGRIGIAKSTASLWLRYTKLSRGAQDRLKRRNLLGYYKTSLRWQAKRIAEDHAYRETAARLLKTIKISRNLSKLLAAITFWCEGNKIENSTVKFTNSDPQVISTFLRLVEKGFGIKPQQWKALIHLHDYHSEIAQKRFWSQRTKIPLQNFNRSYRKPHTGKRERENYPGCLALACHNARLVKELKAIWKVFAKNMGV